MLFKELKENTIFKLQECINISLQEATIETEILLNHVFNVTKKDLILYPEMTLPENKLEAFNSLVKRRIKEKIPLQYLTNKAYFMGEEFYVDENVLIPRPETEILVEEVLKSINETNLKILDIGTGSGCIACMLAKNINEAEVFACDISEKALEVAKFNAKKLEVLNKIKFILSDIFENIDKNLKFDVIVSNPPYISINKKSELQPEVALHEPKQALFVSDEKGISFYERLVFEARSRLAENGILAVEIGINQSFDVAEIFKSNGFKEIDIIKDYAGIDRIVAGKFVKY